jgi:hypothetical protein
VQSSIGLWSLKLLTELATLYVGVGDRSNSSVCLCFVVLRQLCGCGPPRAVALP